jgi:integrase
MIIRLPGVKRVKAKGHIYHYHRATMTRLPGIPGSAEFLAALADADAKHKAARATKPLPGTLGGLIAAYRASPEFTELAPRTRLDYQKVFDYLKPIETLALVQIDAPYLYKVRDKAFSKKKRRFANYCIQVLSRLFNWGKRRGLAPGNPAADVEPIRRPRDAKPVNRPWTDKEIAIVLAASSPELKVAIALGAYLGLREGDVLATTWRSYDGAAFEIRQRKTGEPLWVPARRLPRRPAPINLEHKVSAEVNASRLHLVFRLRHLVHGRKRASHAVEHTLNRRSVPATTTGGINRLPI